MLDGTVTTKHRFAPKLEDADRVLLPLLRRAARWLSSSAQASLKAQLRPICALDYPTKSLLLHAEDDLDWLRARSCEKEPETIAWLERELRPDDVLYDVGANVGAYSMVAASRYPGIRVHAFEPGFANFERLVRNMFLNRLEQQITAHPLAIARATAAQHFNYQSIEPGAALHTLGEPLDYRGQAFAPRYRQLVLGVSLDDLVFRFGYPAPNLLKVDVDGTEFDVVQGGDRLLATAALRSVVVEIGSRAGYEKSITEFLADRGLTLTGRHVHNADVVNCIFSRRQ
jgi:FkbM family methyltransferase